MRCLCSGFGAKVRICGTCAADLKRHRSESQQMLYLCSGFGANVTICGACAADLGQERKSAAGARGPRGGLVKHAFSSKVSVLPRREHRLFENRFGGVPLSDFTVTLHLQCNLTELKIYVWPDTPLTLC